MERTLILIKPDGVQRSLSGEILSRLEKSGLKITGLKLLHVDENLAKEHYAEHVGKPFFGDLVSYICSAPIIALALSGPNADTRYCIDNLCKSGSFIRSAAVS